MGLHGSYLVHKFSLVTVQFNRPGVGSDSASHLGIRVKVQVMGSGSGAGFWFRKGSDSAELVSL